MFNCSEENTWINVSFERRIKTETHSEVKAGGHVIRLHQQGVLFVDASVVVGRPGLWQGAVVVSHHPVGLENLLQVLSQTGAVVHNHSQLLHLQPTGSYGMGPTALQPLITVYFYHLCQSPPVHVGASNKHVLPVNDPELAVEDAMHQAAKVHPPHLDSFRQSDTTRGQHTETSTLQGLIYIMYMYNRNDVHTFLLQYL